MHGTGRSRASGPRAAHIVALRPISLRLPAALVIALALAVALPAGAAELSGRVVAVHDGDTITLLDAGRHQHKIRLTGIDAPELKQAFGTRSKQHLSDLLYGQDVHVEWDKHDRYGRIVGKVFTESPCTHTPCPFAADANVAQISAGLAWHYKQYQREQSAEDRNLYAAAEAEARLNKAGLWVDAAPVPPWEWRRK